jgi:hypothetical protein
LGILTVINNCIFPTGGTTIQGKVYNVDGTIVNYYAIGSGTQQNFAVHQGWTWTLDTITLPHGLSTSQQVWIVNDDKGNIWGTSYPVMDEYNHTLTVVPWPGHDIPGYTTPLPTFNVTITNTTSNTVGLRFSAEFMETQGMFAGNLINFSAVGPGQTRTYPFTPQTTSLTATVNSGNAYFKETNQVTATVMYTGSSLTLIPITPTIPIPSVSAPAVVTTGGYAVTAPAAPAVTAPSITTTSMIPIFIVGAVLVGGILYFVLK